MTVVGTNAFLFGGMTDVGTDDSPEAESMDCGQPSN
eukprot:CAMPEP_0173204736 /NCGR_PEP_ID=MMETSP1141-20130122/20306_1 /TAXON_ID=483371 /ORGANISM="non described non described, Strain CCMP2298" /LENGTH=35 /DNA_ID= /DNA_START= /DNA_END= /DNA_ORIENTATION=